MFRPSSFELGYPKDKLDNKGNKIKVGDKYAKENLKWWMRFESY